MCDQLRITLIGWDNCPDSVWIFSTTMFATILIVFIDCSPPLAGCVKIKNC